MKKLQEIERTFLSNFRQSFWHQVRRFDIVCVTNAKNISAKRMRIVFCKEGTNVISKEDSENMKIFYGNWAYKKGIILNKDNKDFKYFVPTDDNVDWDKQIKLIYTALAGCKKSKKMQGVSEKISDIKKALDLVEKLKAKKREKMIA